MIKASIDLNYHSLRVIKMAVCGSKLSDTPRDRQAVRLHRDHRARTRSHEDVR